MIQVRPGGTDRQKASTPETPGEITTLLREWQAGDALAADRVLTKVYPYLHRIARRELARERGERALQATELVNELYLRLEGHDRVPWRSRGQFFAIAVRTVRRVLVDAARSRGAAKRGGEIEHLALEADGTRDPRHLSGLVDLDDSLNRLARIDDVACRLVELRFFVGLTTQEAAAVLGLSRTTAIRRWQFARAWLREDLR